VHLRPRDPQPPRRPDGRHAALRARRSDVTVRSSWPEPSLGLLRFSPDASGRPSGARTHRDPTASAHPSRLGDNPPRSCGPCYGLRRTGPRPRVLLVIALILYAISAAFRRPSRLSAAPCDINPSDAVVHNSSAVCTPMENAALQFYGQCLCSDRPATQGSCASSNRLGTPLCEIGDDGPVPTSRAIVLLDFDCPAGPQPMHVFNPRTHACRAAHHSTVLNVSQRGSRILKCDEWAGLRSS